MGKVGRYCTALTRYRKSKGFGIHSPFAFHFVLNVLREKAAYYAYADIAERRDEARRMKRLLKVGKPRMISGKSARMMFRIANYFNPKMILQLGTDFGVSAYSTLRVASDSKMWLAGIQAEPGIALALLQSQADRVSVSGSCVEAVDDYIAAVGGNRRYVVVNRVPEAESVSVERWLVSLAEVEAVVVVRNLQNDEVVARLWHALLSRLTYGMAFTNGKMGVVVIEKKLPLQTFSLWF